MTNQTAAGNIAPPPLLVWDADSEPWHWDGRVVLWRGFAQAEAQNTTSIHRIVEEESNELRAQYLAWLYDLGEALIDGKRVVDHLELRHGLSYWWMTLPSVVSLGSATPVYNAVRMLALERLARTFGCRSVTLASGDKALVTAIRKWCGNAGLEFRWHRIGAKAKPVGFAERIFRALPYPLQGLTSLFIYLKQRWPLRLNKDYFDKCAPDGITFVDYFMNLDSQAASQGRFGSNYWTGLVGVLREYGRKTNWIHHYQSDSFIRSARQASELIDIFNKRATDLQNHATLDCALSLAVLWGVVRDYLRVFAMGVKLSTARLQFTPKGSDVDFEPLLREDWRKFMSGNTAVLNCLLLNLFENLLRRMPLQRLCVYLQENQPWEMALIHAWKTAGHGRLVGVPHSTVLFWDTRYYFDPRTYRRKGNNELPVPFLVALNGPSSMARYRDGGYPEDQMVEVEALRYLFMDTVHSVRSTSKVNSQKPLHVLVLGDYYSSVTRHQMELLRGAAGLLPSNTCYTVKPHPSCAIRDSDYPSLRLRMSRAPVSELLAECDVAFTGNITSAAADAYSAKVPVVSVLDGNAFNMSPLRGLEGVVYVTTAVELADALRNVRNHEPAAAEPYFCADSRLPRWRKLLGLRPENGSSNQEDGKPFD